MGDESLVVDDESSCLDGESLIVDDKSSCEDDESSCVDDESSYMPCNMGEFNEERGTSLCFSKHQKIKHCQ